MLGDTMNTLVSWTWDRSGMRFDAEHGEHTMRVQFHKVGGRWSKTLPDGAPTPGAGSSYWTSDVDGDRSSVKHQNSDQAKAAAVAEFIRRFGKQ